MRALLAVALCLLAACCASVPERAADSRASVLRLELDGSVCTGVAIGPNALLTAAHCFGDTTVGAMKINGKPAGFAIAANDGHDHVIVRVSSRLHHLALIGPMPPAGTFVYLWGNPLGLEGVLRTGRLAGEIDCLGKPKGTCTMVLVDIHATFGDSGAAIFDAQGRIVTLQSGGISARGWTMPYAYRLHFTPEQLAAARL